MPAEDVYHHVVPLGRPFHGPDVEDNLILICPTQHSAVHALIRAYLKARKEGRSARPDEVARFSPFTRRLARRALDALDAKEAPP
jgi:5-methylcytosine-specific restriction endonuclease McrA